MKISIALNVTLCLILALLLLSRNSDISETIGEAETNFDSRSSFEKDEQSEELREFMMTIRSEITNLAKKIENQTLPLTLAEKQLQSATVDYLANTEKERNKIPIFDGKGFPIAEFRENERAVYFRDGVYIPEDNKLLLTDREEIAQGLVSKSGDENGTVRVLNNTDEVVYVFWIDFEGNLQWRGKVAVGAEWGQHTYHGHPFAFTDKKGNLLGTFTADGEGELYELQ